MKNKPYKTFKPPKNKQKVIALVCGTALSFCSIIAPLTAYTANADVVDYGNGYIPDVALNDYYRHPLGGFSVSCWDSVDEHIDVFDCPSTYGGTETVFSNRLNLPSYSAWQNTLNGTFDVSSREETFVWSGDATFQLVGLNVALVPEHIGDIGWAFNTGSVKYSVLVQYKPIYNSGAEPPEDYYVYEADISWWNDGNWRFYWSDIFDDMPDETFANDGTALFDWIAISFRGTDDVENYAVFNFSNAGGEEVTMAQYAGTVNALYNWIYNGSPIETILSFPIDFLKTEIFPDFSFGTLLLIALGVIMFSLGLKIAFGG